MTNTEITTSDGVSRTYEGEPEEWLRTDGFYVVSPDPGRTVWINPHQIVRMEVTL